MIVTGSQQGLDITGRVFLDKDDVVLIESPSYLGAIGAFALEQPKFVEVPTDGEGMIPEELEKLIQTTERVKFIYVIPNYQNPTGICWSLERRRKLMELATKYEIPVFEDNPYGDLRFEGEEIAPLISMDPKHLVMYSGTFSKTLAPGMRLAWMVCNDDILAKWIWLKDPLTFIHLPLHSVKWHSTCRIMTLKDMSRKIADYTLIDVMSCVTQ